MMSKSHSFALAASAGVAAGMDFTMYSQPIRLKYGQVYNKMQSDGDIKEHAFPQAVIDRYASGEKWMSITGFDVDIVRKNSDGSEQQVKLDDHYLHHYILYFGEATSMRLMAEAADRDPVLKHMLTSCHGMKGDGIRMFNEQLASGKLGASDVSGVGFGGAAGAEYRHNPQRFQEPYGLLLHKPEVWFPTFHVINTKNDTHKVSPLLECPCTPQRKIDPAAGTIDGHKPHPAFGCSEEFEKTGNPSCSLSTYVGGWRCCENDVFLIDTDKLCKDPTCSEEPVDEIFMKYKFYYEDATTSSRAMEGGACCDTTSNWQGDGNIEHDVPACPPGTPKEECIYVTESVQPVGYYKEHWWQSGHKGSDLVDLVFAAPHLHWAGISMELIDHETNKTLCKVERTPGGGVMYGNGTTPGNEDGYLVGLTPCSWSGENAPRVRRDHKLRSRSVYDATTTHTGVMSLWLNSVAAVSTGKTDVVV